MSNRYAHNQHRQDSGTQKKFVPKSRNAAAVDANPTPTLSNSLRRSSTQQAGGSSSSSGGAAASSTSRLRLGEGGEWVSNRNKNGRFVNYLPQDEAVAAGFGASEGGLDPVESQRVVDLLNKELSRLLKLNPREFWKEVAGDSSLHEFLDSFLKFRSRWYDFPHHGAKGIVAGVIVGEVELSHRVFMLLYRISSNRDPGARAADALSAVDHGALLQEKKLLDLPKLLDICAIYGHENEELTRSLVSNALKAQPWITYNLSDIASHFMRIMQTMQDRCTTSLEILSVPGICEDNGINKLHSDLLEVMDFINDAISSMDAFLDAFKHAAVFFQCPIDSSNGNDDLLHTVVKLHDSLLPSLQKGLRSIYSSGDVISSGDSIKSTTAISLKMLSMRLVKFGWKLLDVCYLSEEAVEDSSVLPFSSKILPSKVEDPMVRGEVILQTFREISSLSVQVQESQNHETFLHKIQRSYDIISRAQSLQSSGWIVVDDEQLQYLSNVTGSTLRPATESTPFVPIRVVSSNDKAQIDEDAVVLESKISQIKDLFPDYGKGFLMACLEVYNHNPEEVIQRILEGTLHQDLQSLDTSLDTAPLPKTATTVSTKDKGKGKIIESDIRAPLKNPAPPPASTERQIEGSSSSSSSSYGRFIRKSRSDKPDSIILDTRDEKETAKISNLAAQYEYEDEYDDSFDDLGLSGVESGFEDSEKLNVGSSTETSSSMSSGKWGSKRKPQFYVKDGKNYSYKVEGSVGAANAGEAYMMNQAHSELIHGLGRGGNLPMGAVRKLEESHPVEERQHDDAAEGDGRGSGWNPNHNPNPRGGGRGRRGGRGRGFQDGEGGRGGRGFPNGQESPVINAYVEEGRGGFGDNRGRGRGGRGFPDGQESTVMNASEEEGRGGFGDDRGRGRGGRNHSRKDRAMKKHFASVSGR